MVLIEGNTLYVIHESGNLGHYFNDHAYSAFAYYLENKESIHTIYINCRDSQRKDIDFLAEGILSKKVFEGHANRYKNASLLSIFFLDCTKKIIFNNEDYTFENLIVTKSDRFFRMYVNYLQVFTHLHNNLHGFLQTNNMNIPPVDVSILCRKKGAREMKCIENFEKMLSQEKYSYQCLDLSNYSFIDIVTMFHTSKHIVSTWGCELTYGIFMKEGTTILTIEDSQDSWWKIMENYYTQYGIVYKRVNVHLEGDARNGCIVLSNEICCNILQFIKLE